jgi:RHS repeat-associated protein
MMTHYDCGEQVCSSHLKWLEDAVKRSFRPAAKRGVISEVKNLDTSRALAAFRIYNPSIGKFLSVDALTKSYPWYTPYQFASNSPIANSDLDGLEAKLEIYSTDKKGNVWLTVSDKFDLYKNGQIIGAQKISQKQFNKTLDTMWQTFTKEKTAGYIVQGFDQYRSNSSMSVSGTTKHNDQSQGTLTIASTDDNYVVAVYDPTVVKQRKPVTFKESYDMTMKAKDVFF